MPKRTFVGFGFGAIQTGLFLYEAQQSANFDRLVIAYRRPEIIQSIRENKGFFYINIAHPNHIEHVQIGPIEIYDINNPNDQNSIINAIAEASELATALSSVRDYESKQSNSIHHLLSKGLTKKLQNASAPALIYTAENDNHAAEKLERLVQSILESSLVLQLSGKVQFVNTVIGKMSGTIREKSIIKQHGLRPLTDGLSLAFLVESFNKISISNVQLNEFERGLGQFEEKSDLLAFEEAKLYGHNATHALAAYIGIALDLKYIRDLEQQAGAVGFLRDAFINESGTTLIAKYKGLDPLFSKHGYTNFVNDLLMRMMNPFLNDSVERVARDPKRKLAWNDRLIGTIRLAIKHDVQAKHFAFGAAAALEQLAPTHVESFLKDLWQQDDTKECRDVLKLIAEATLKLEQWKAQGYPNLQTFFKP